MSFKADKILSLASQFEKKATAGISQKSNKKYLASFDKLISKFGQSFDNYGGEGVSPSQMTAEQLATHPEDLEELYRKNLISPAQYRDAQALVDKKNPNIMQMPEDGISGSRSVLHMPDEKISAKPPTPGSGGVKYRPEVVNVQKALNDMISRGKLQGKLLDPDGKLGPLTQKLMDTYKASIGVPSMNNEEVIKALNTKPDTV